MGPLEYLQYWYVSHCDGDWEHGFGIRITTLDNPGWLLTVNLEETELAGHVMEWLRLNESDSVWLHYMSDGRQFTAACGPRELGRAFAAFKWFAENHSSVANELG